MFLLDEWEVSFCTIPVLPSSAAVRAPQDEHLRAFHLACLRDNARTATARLSSVTVPVLTPPVKTARSYCSAFGLPHAFAAYPPISCRRSNLAYGATLRRALGHITWLDWMLPATACSMARFFSPARLLLPRGIFY